jgi:hypothetical protein
MPSPPQGFTVILPGEITQSDLDPQQPPAKLSSYPLTIGKDTPGPNESNYIANDNTGNLLDIVNSDTSNATLSALKMAIDALTIIRANGKLAVNLANENIWSAAQSFTAGLATNSLDLNGAGSISALVSSFKGRTGAVVPVLGDYSVGVELPSANESNYIANDNTGNLLDIVNSDISDATLSASKVAIDDLTLMRTNEELAINLANANTWSAAQSFTAGLATNSLNLNGAGAISALVSSFNGRTGAVIPASGDYSHHTVVNGSRAIPFRSNLAVVIATIKTGPNGVVFWCGSCLTETPASGDISVIISGTTSKPDFANGTAGMGVNSTAGGTWSIGKSSGDYYPVILTGVADASIGSLSPNTTYNVAIGNSGSSTITVESINLTIIGL